MRKLAVFPELYFIITASQCTWDFDCFEFTEICDVTVVVWLLR